MSIQIHIGGKNDISPRDQSFTPKQLFQKHKKSKYISNLNLFDNTYNNITIIMKMVM